MDYPENALEGRLARSASLGGSLRWIRTQFAMLSYWIAIVLPLLYLPLLLARIETTGELLLFLGIFGLHVLALIGGRSHRRPSSR